MVSEDLKKIDTINDSSVTLFAIVIICKINYRDNNHMVNYNCLQ